MVNKIGIKILLVVFISFTLMVNEGFSLEWSGAIEEIKAKCKASKARQDYGYILILERWQAIWRCLTRQRSI